MKEEKIMTPTRCTEKAQKMKIMNQDIDLLVKYREYTNADLNQSSDNNWEAGYVLRMRTALYELHGN
jgi:hypothetical protein